MTEGRSGGALSRREGPGRLPPLLLPPPPLLPPRLRRRRPPRHIQGTVRTLAMQTHSLYVVGFIMDTHFR